MANGTGYIAKHRKSLGDIAVDGLLAGMAAGLVMGLVLLLLGVLDGIAPLDMLGRFDPANRNSAAAGGLLHLAVSGLYGVLFALVGYFPAARWQVLRRYSWLIGAVFGLALWLAAHLILLPGLNSGLAEIAPLTFALGHLVYGLGLGYIVGRHSVEETVHR